MGFGVALNYLRVGYKITRDGWTGKGQYIILARMNSCTLADGVVIKPNHEDIGSNFIMFVGTSDYQCGWLSSQGDILAEDWRAINE